VGSLVWAAHLLKKNNAGVLRGIHEEHKSPIEQKGVKMNLIF